MSNGASLSVTHSELTDTNRYYMYWCW